MRKKFQRLTALILITSAIVSFLTGCYDRRELDTLGIVLGVALDTADNGQSKMTVQMVKVGAQGGSKKASKEGGGGGEEPYINLSGTGKNMNIIIREMQNKMSRRIYVAHNQVIIFGEDLAKRGVRDNLDFFARAAEARMTTHVFVARGEGEDILKVKPSFEKLPSTELISILRSEKLTSDAPIVTEFEFASRIISKTTSAVAPIVTVNNEGEEERLKTEGCAVFKESKMVGELSNDETNGMLFVNGKVKTAIISVEALGSTAAMEIRKAKSKLKPEISKDGSIKITVEISEIVGLGDQTGAVNLSDAENSKSLHEATKRETERIVWEAINKSKKLNADVFGFGDAIGRKYPKEWKELEKKWGEKYKDVKVEVNVKVKGDGSGRLNAPLVPKKN